MIPFGEYRPDVSDHKGQHTASLSNVVPRGDGYGPVPQFSNYSAALLAACRGMFFARQADGSVVIFAGTSDRLFKLDNSTQTWVPVSKVAAVTSISNASPAVVSYTSHPFVANDPVVFSTSGSLPTGLTAGTVYYVSATGLAANEFSVSLTAGGARINTSSSGSGTHSVTNTYTALSTTAQWQFRQFNKYVFAVQANIAPQVYDLTSSSAFADLGGSPPQAAYISIVNRFVVLTGIASPNVYRVQWSGLNATTTWTSGTSQSDSQDLTDGGIVRGIAGGESGVIFQDGMIRRMVYAPGSPYIFGIELISSDDGLLAPYSIISAQDRHFWISPQGFKMLVPGGYPQPIGKERVDRTFFAEVDLGSPQLIIGANDPRTTRVYWAYKTQAGTTGQFDKILCYDWALDKWTPIASTGEFLVSLALPGLTLEGVDTAYGDDIDDLDIGSLDDIATSAYSRLAGASATHRVGFFSGGNLEATLKTAEQGGDRRVFVRGFRPVTDASTVYGSVEYRETERASSSTSAETAVNAIGVCPQRVSTRFARGVVRIPAGEDWNYASGIEPDFVVEGGR